MRTNLLNVKTITSLEGVSAGQKVIPLGIVASKIYLQKFPEGRIAFIIDSALLCFESMVKFYTKRKIFFNKHLIGAALRYVKYYFIEKKVTEKFDKVVVVSEHDASYLREKFNCSNIEVIMNGADFPDLSHKKPKEFDFTFGILSYWGAGNYHDVEWFFTDYLPKLRKIYPGAKVITAGRGADEETLQVFERNGIEHLGEIDDLWDFFNRIDIYITTLRKECGILNKVLDAMAHKKIVVGLEHNMYAFKNLKDGYFTYKNLGELVADIEMIKKDPESVQRKVNNAYQFLYENNNWTDNYQRMKSLIDQQYNK